MESKQKCTRCYIKRDLDQFIAKSGRTGLITCQRCRDMKMHTKEYIERSKQKQKDYYKKINEEYVVCDCGKKYKYSSVTSHRRTKFHINYEKMVDVQCFGPGKRF
jgi:hypothetical protein